MFFPKTFIGIPKINQAASCKLNCDSYCYRFNQIEEDKSLNLSCCLENNEAFASSNSTTLPKIDIKTENSELKLIHMAASLGLTRYFTKKYYLRIVILL